MLALSKLFIYITCQIPNIFINFTSLKYFGMKRLYSDPTEPEYDYMESLQSEEPEGTYRINRDLNLAHRPGA